MHCVHITQVNLPPGSCRLLRTTTHVATIQCIRRNLWARRWTLTGWPVCRQVNHRFWKHDLQWTQCHQYISVCVCACVRVCVCVCEWVCVYDAYLCVWERDGERERGRERAKERGERGNEGWTWVMVWLVMWQCHSRFIYIIKVYVSVCLTWQKLKLASNGGGRWY